MSSSKLDQIVKGAPPPGSAASLIQSTSSDTKIVHPPQSFPSTTAGTLTSEPASDQPSTSPSFTYLDLLILEASLRSQYLTLRDRRRQNVFFIFLLSIWVAAFAYLLFLRPREDGSGIGGSVYWVVETSEKVALMGGMVTAVLIWGTGQWERGVRWPRRWLSVANRGLRNINAKIVVIKGPWWKEMLGYFVFLFPYSALFPRGESVTYIDAGMAKHRPDNRIEISGEEDLSPGGDHIKLLLLPKLFSPDFRDNWEMYRLEYWEKENERRCKLRQLVRKQEIELARLEGGWFRFTRPNRYASSQTAGEWVSALLKFDVSYRRSGSIKQKSTGSNEKVHHRHNVEKDRQRRLSFVQSETHSRNASRSSTPSILDPDERPSMGRNRRGSSTNNITERRRRSKSSASFELTNASKVSLISRPA